jgi:hypothetical protein
MHIAKDFFCLGGIFGVDVDADFGVHVRRHFGAASHECTAWPLAKMAPFDV